MNKKVVISVIVVIVVGLLVWFVSGSRKDSASSVDTSTTGGDNAYTQELDGLNQADVQAEFKGIDADLQQL